MTRFLVSLFLSFLAVSTNAIGQNVDEPSDWHKEIGRESNFYTRLDFRRYTIEDVDKAKSKYLSIVSKVRSDEWSGTYTRGTMLGYEELVWNQSDGFVIAFTYHTLGSLDYGRVKIAGNSISFISEKTVHRTETSLEDYVRVRFGDRHLLVGKGRLADFAKLAVGREVLTGRRKKEVETESSFFWEMVGEEEKSISETPEFPVEYRRLVLKPIKLNIVKVGRLRVKKETSAQWGTTSIDHLTDLTLSAGFNSGVRRGMRFWIDDLEESVDVISVRANSSVAVLTRFIVDGVEYCEQNLQSKQERVPCRSINVGMNARTRSDYFQ